MNENNFNNQGEKRKKDPLTKELFLPARSNQKFACAENRIKYNNQKAKQFRDLTSVEITALQRNFKILMGLGMHPGYSKTISKERLIGMGYNFDYFTSVTSTIDGKKAFGCFNFELIYNPGDNSLLIKKH